MDDLKARQAEVREQAKAINAGRTPKFGDKMRNPWASEQNPTRDGIFVRQNRVTGTGLRYEMTDGKGKFWESNGDTMMFLDHLTEQPQEPAATVKPVAWPLGFKVRHVDGHGWIIEPPYGSRWVAFDGTPAGDFMHAMTAAPQSQSTQAAKTELDDPLTLWRAIAEEAGAVVQSGVKYLMLTEEMCVRLGSALEALPRPSEAEISKKALDAILWMYRRLKPTTGELQFIEDAIRALSHQPAQAMPAHDAQTIAALRADLRGIGIEPAPLDPLFKSIEG